MGTQHGGAHIGLVFFFGGGLCTETYSQVYDLAEDAVRNLTVEELGRLQREVARRKRQLKRSHAGPVGFMRGGK